MAVAIDIGDALRSVAPISPRRDRAPDASDGHTVLFYEAEAALIADVAHFLGTALAAGGSAVVLATKAHRDALAERLAFSGMGTTLALAPGRYVACDADEALAQIMVGGHPDPQRFAQIVGTALDQAGLAAEKSAPPVAVYGELVALLCYNGQSDKAIALEGLWNDLAETRPFTLRCGYPLDALARAGDSEAMTRICAAHTRVVPAETYAELAVEDDRQRAIAMWQQKARALEAEVAARSLAQEALAERNRELAEALALRDAFVAAVTHDLKTPLASIQGHSQLMQRHIRRAGLADPDRTLAGLREIDQATFRMRRQIDQLLDVAHLQAGRPLDLDRRPTDLVALAQASLDEYRVAAPRHRLTLECDRPAVVGEWDPARLERLVDNLVSNAIKYSPDGGDVVVTIRRPREASADWVTLTVRDEGIGIPPSEIGGIFERFQRASNVNERITGTGIGLASARQVAIEHGGSIAVQSREGAGSVFTVRLPSRAPDGLAKDRR